ncbi:MAG: hypothetical protein GXY70_08770 [Euryarchaeota archaeon]|nr:hypothetical protein [Euryarchaeota archaeon]
MIEMDTDLEQNDHIYLITCYLGVKRVLLKCPKCGKPLRTCRYIYGSKQEGRGI